VLAVRELEQDVHVGVRDHGASILSAMASVASTETFAITNLATGGREGSTYGVDDWLETKYVCLGVCISPV
jgi:hypothetical protein